MRWRLHLEGIEVGDRWAGLTDAWEATVDDGYYAFNDAHAMMAFVGGGRERAAARLLETMERRAGGRGTNAMMTRDVGLPFARSIAAFGRGAWGPAVELIGPVVEVAHRFGGSNAQRDVDRKSVVAGKRW